MSKVYGLKYSTDRMQYQHMNFVMEWRQNLDDLRANPDGRHVALELIKKAMGDAYQFNSWYSQTYELRRTGKQTEYEAAIFAKLAEIQQAQQLQTGD